jgi:hypothetical protein
MNMRNSIIAVSLAVAAIMTAISVRATAETIADPPIVQVINGCVVQIEKLLQMSPDLHDRIQSPMALCSRSLVTKYPDLAACLFEDGMPDRIDAAKWRKCGGPDPQVNQRIALAMQHANECSVQHTGDRTAISHCIRDAFGLNDDEAPETTKCLLALPQDTKDENVRNCLPERLR